jgi:hypothetical protein
MNESLAPELDIDEELLDEYVAVMRNYEAVFGKYNPFTRTSRPLTVRIKEMQDKLDEYYRQQRTPQTEKREPEMAHA